MAKTEQKETGEKIQRSNLVNVCQDRKHCSQAWTIILILFKQLILWSVNSQKTLKNQKSAVTITSPKHRYIQSKGIRAIYQSILLLAIWKRTVTWCETRDLPRLSLGCLHKPVDDLFVCCFNAARLRISFLKDLCRVFHDGPKDVTLYTFFECLVSSPLSAPQTESKSSILEFRNGVS